MTTIEICNSYQMSIIVTAIFNFIAGRYCAKVIFFLIGFFFFFFFFCEGTLLFESKIKNRRCLQISFSTEHLFFYTAFLFQI